MLITTAQHLDQLRLPERHVKVRFAQIGNDLKGSEYFSRFSDTLPQLGRMTVSWSSDVSTHITSLSDSICFLQYMVDAIPYHQRDTGELRLTEKTLLKVLLEAVAAS